MLSKSLIEMTKGRLREFKREPSAMLFVLLMPILWMLLLGFAFNDKPETSTIHLLVQNTSSLKTLESDFVTSMNAHADIQLEISPLTKKSTLLQKNPLLLVEISNDAVQYTMNPRNPKAKKAHFLVQNYFQDTLHRIDPIPSRIIALANNGYNSFRYIDFLIPGLLAFSIMSTSLFGTGQTIVSNRRENLLKRYRVTPIKTYEYFLSHVLGRFLIALLEITVILSFGFFVFNFKIVGSVMEFLGMCLLGVACFSSLAICLGSRFKNSSSYNSMINVVVFLLMFLSGIWFSKENYPFWVQNLSSFLPLTAFVDAVRAIALDGTSIKELLKPIIVLCVYLGASATLAKKYFLWY